MSTRQEFLAELAQLARDLIPSIGDDFRSSDDDDTPSMQVTIGADHSGWSYQTGDNSFTGGAYGYPFWGIAVLTRDTDPQAFAEEILTDLENQTQDEHSLFFKGDNRV